MNKAIELNEMPEGEKLKNVQKSLDYDELVQRYIEESKLSIGSTTFYLLQKGSTNQRLSAIQRLAVTFSDTTEIEINDILRYMKSSFETEELIIQTEAPLLLEPLISLLKPVDTEIVFDMCVILSASTIIAVRKVWNKLMKSTINCLSSDCINTKVLSFCIDSSSHSKPEDQRIFCCDLIHILCSAIDDNDIITKRLFPLILSLCQDTDFSIRGGVATSIPSISRVVGYSLTVDMLLPALHLLLNDEEVCVMEAAISAYVNLSEHWDSSEFTETTLYPLFTGFIANPPPSLYPILTKEIGRLVWITRNLVREHNAYDAIFQFFFSHCRSESSQIRKNCAFNLPAILVSFQQVLPHWFEKITTVVHDLSRDPSSDVKATVAAELHELVKIYNTSATQLTATFNYLFNNCTMNITGILMPHLPLFIEFCVIKQSQSIENIIKTAIEYEPLIRYKWRRVETLFQTLSQISLYINPQTIIQKVIPQLIWHLQHGAATIRTSLSKCLIELISTITNHKYIAEIFIDTITTVFTNSSSYSNRIIFLHLFVYCTFIYSRKLLMYLFLDALCMYSKDKIDAVKLLLADIIPYLLNGDSTLEEAVHTIVTSLLDSNKPDITSKIMKLSKDYPVIKAHLNGRFKALRCPISTLTTDKFKQTTSTINTSSLNVTAIKCNLVSEKSATIRAINTKDPLSALSNTRSPTKPAQMILATISTRVLANQMLKVFKSAIPELNNIQQISWDQILDTAHQHSLECEEKDLLDTMQEHHKNNKKQLAKGIIQRNYESIDIDNIVKLDNIPKYKHRAKPKEQRKITSHFPTGVNALKLPTIPHKTKK